MLRWDALGGGEELGRRSDLDEVVGVLISALAVLREDADGAHPERVIGPAERLGRRGDDRPFDGLVRLGENRLTRFPGLGQLDRPGAASGLAGAGGLADTEAVDRHLDGVLLGIDAIERGDGPVELGDLGRLLPVLDLALAQESQQAGEDQEESLLAVDGGDAGPAAVGVVRLVGSRALETLVEDPAGPVQDSRGRENGLNRLRAVETDVPFPQNLDELREPELGGQHRIAGNGHQPVIDLVEAGVLHPEAVDVQDGIPVTDREADRLAVGDLLGDLRGLDDTEDQGPVAPNSEGGDVGRMRLQETRTGNVGRVEIDLDGLDQLRVGLVVHQFGDSVALHLKNSYFCN